MKPVAASVNTPGGEANLSPEQKAQNELKSSCASQAKAIWDKGLVKQGKTAE